VNSGQPVLLGTCYLQFFWKRTSEVNWCSYLTHSHMPSWHPNSRYQSTQWKIHFCQHLANTTMNSYVGAETLQCRTEGWLVDESHGYEISITEHRYWHITQQPQYSMQLEKASTHTSTKTHAGNVFVTHDLDLLHSDPEINGISGPIVKHFYVKIGDPSCTGYWAIMLKQTYKHENGGKNFTPATTMGMGKNSNSNPVLSLMGTM